MQKRTSSVFPILYIALTDRSTYILIPDLENDLGILFLFDEKLVWLDQSFVSLDHLNMYCLSN